MRSPLDVYRTTRLLASNTKALEAQVFRRVLYQLETATQISGLEQAKALADLRLLWVTVRRGHADHHPALSPAICPQPADRGDLTGPRAARALRVRIAGCDSDP